MDEQKKKTKTIVISTTDIIYATIFVCILSSLSLYAHRHDFIQLT